MASLRRSGTKAVEREMVWYKMQSHFCRQYAKCLDKFSYCKRWPLSCNRLKVIEAILKPSAPIARECVVASNKNSCWLIPYLTRSLLVNLSVVCWVWLTGLDSSPWYCREQLGIELAWEPKTNGYVTEYPVPQCIRRPGIINWGGPRRSVFPGKSLIVSKNCQKITYCHNFPSSIGIFLLLLS